MAKKAPKKMRKRNFPSNKARARMISHAENLNLNARLQEAGFNAYSSNTELGTAAADRHTAGLVPNKAGKKMQANKKLKTPQTGRDVPLPKSKF